MKKGVELLSPVGDFECLKAAVQNGANSVYFGGNLFNARASASNFDYDELEKAINYCSLRNVKTHLTLNTLIKDSEFEDAVLLAKKAYELGDRRSNCTRCWLSTVSHEVISRPSYTCKYSNDYT